MQINLKSLVVSAGVLCATAAFAANQASFDVPFNFTAKGKSYPARSYRVALDRDDNFVSMTSNADASKHLTWIVNPAEAASAPAIVKFDQVGADYALRSIQVGRRVTPALDKNIQPAVSATTSISGQ